MLHWIMDRCLVSTGCRKPEAGGFPFFTVSKQQRQVGWDLSWAHGMWEMKKWDGGSGIRSEKEREQLTPAQISSERRERGGLLSVICQRVNKGAIPKMRGRREGGRGTRGWGGVLYILSSDSTACTGLLWLMLAKTSPQKIHVHSWHTPTLNWLYFI